MLTFLIKRAGEHISTSLLTGKGSVTTKNLKLKINALCHACLFDDFIVLNYESLKFKRLIKGSLLVTKDKPLLSKQVKSLELELF